MPNQPSDQSLELEAIRMLHSIYCLVAIMDSERNENKEASFTQIIITTDIHTLAIKTEALRFMCGGCYVSPKVQGFLWLYAI